MSIPTIAVFSKATVPLGIDVDKLIAALQIQVDRDFAPIWGTPCKLVKASDFIKGAWSIVFYDDADQPGALAYHDVGPDGLPISKVFIKTIAANKESVSSATSHELVEMLADPSCAACMCDADGKTFRALESADPVEETSYKIGAIEVSNFVYPAWFESFHKPKSMQFDYLKLVDRPFKLLKGGYQSVFKSGKWSEVFASKAKEARFKKEDRRGHRTELRKQKRAA